MGNDGVKNAGGEAAIGPDEIIAAVMKAKAGAVLPVIGETEMDRSASQKALPHLQPKPRSSASFPPVPPGGEIFRPGSASPSICRPLTPHRPRTG